MKHNKLQIIYNAERPCGIRDEDGFLFFFASVTKFPDQKERYHREIQEQRALAEYLLAALQEREEVER